ncbi:MAG: hypothetical protein ACTH8F_16830 [Microbacterium sp.]
MVIVTHGSGSTPTKVKGRDQHSVAAIEVTVAELAEQDRGP